MSAKLKSLFCLVCMLIAVALIPSTASSELWPYKVGDTYKYKASVDGDFDSYEYTIVTEKLSIDMKDYYRLVLFDPDAPEPAERFGFVSGLARSTEDALYEYNPDGDEVLLYQSGDIGTTWENYINEESGYDYLFSGIIDNDISYVTSEFGTFYPTSKFYTDMCKNSDHTDCVRELYWITPGYGYLNRNVDEVVGNVTWELADIIPPDIHFFFVPYNKFEDGRINFSFYFGFGTGNDPAEGLYYRYIIPIEDFGLFEPGSSVELFDSEDNPVSYHDMSIWHWNISRSDAGFNHESMMLARIDDGFYTPDATSWRLNVVDVNGKEYEFVKNNMAFVDLPFISASSFCVSYDGPELGWNFDWDNPDLGSFPWEQTTFVANILLYNGESYIGEYYFAREPGTYMVNIPSDYIDQCNRVKLQNHIRMNDWSSRAYSNMISVPLHDEDGDGISDLTDTLPSVSSADFSDGTTTGTIIDNGGMLLSVTDAAMPEEGVFLAASCADPSGQCLGKAVIDVCGGVSKINMDMNMDEVSLDTGDEVIVTCGSVILKVIEGLIYAEFTDQSGEKTAVAEIGKGNGINFNQEEFTFTAPESNTEEIVIEVGDEEITLSPGETSINIDIRPFSNYNLILMWRLGLVPVAIFSTDTFYAPDDINQETITFGATGEEASPIPWLTRTTDRNKDGINDLICVFRASETGFQPEDTIGMLKALKTTDEAIKGQDSVIIIGR